MTSSFRIRPELLGWRVPESLRNDQPAWGPGKTGERVDFLIVAPWCPDCQILAQDRSWEALRRPGAQAWLVVEFAPESAAVKFREALGLDWPLLSGTAAKSRVAWVQARFRQIRAACGDDRNWGLPTWVSARWEHGDLVVERFESDF
jgi:hypothetical protein